MVARTLRAFASHEPRLPCPGFILNSLSWQARDSSGEETVFCLHGRGQHLVFTSSVEFFHDRVRLVEEWEFARCNCPFTLAESTILLPCSLHEILRTTRTFATHQVVARREAVMRLADFYCCTTTMRSRPHKSLRVVTMPDDR